LSKSLPFGLYIKKTVPKTIPIGALVLFEIPADTREIMVSRHWIPVYVKYYFMKPVAAKAGDHIIVDSSGVFINERYKGPVHQVDQQGLNLPMIIFNDILKKDTYFVLASSKNSFDSRYFGPIHKQSIINIVEPFLTF
jgi:conjugative transfer signal peptidase TraF